MTSLHKPEATRRAVLAGLATLPLARAGWAAGSMMGTDPTPFRRFRLGAFEITTLLAGTRIVEDPHAVFGLNVSDREFAEVSDTANLPVAAARFFFTPTLVNTGTELVLFDTGLTPDGITQALAAAGYTTDQIDRVVLTHMHPDHIGGLTGDTGATFANAAYTTGAREFDAWAGMENEVFETRMRPLADRTTMIGDGDAVTGGITGMAAFGHTPGHMVYRIESDGQSLLIAADFANHYVWSLAHPDWEVRFDMDKAAAAATRKALLDMLATDRIPFIGYHMPWPGLGYVARRDGAYAWEAASYQLML